MKILKYRQKFAHGSEDWNYTDVYGTNVEYLQEDLNREYDWSDKYRGCEIEIIDASKEFLEKRIEELKGCIVSSTQRIEQLTKELSEL